MKESTRIIVGMTGGVIMAMGIPVSVYMGIWWALLPAVVGATIFTIADQGRVAYVVREILSDM